MLQKKAEKKAFHSIKCLTVDNNHLIIDKKKKPRFLAHTDKHTVLCKHTVGLTLHIQYVANSVAGKHHSVAGNVNIVITFAE